MLSNLECMFGVHSMFAGDSWGGGGCWLFAVSVEGSLEDQLVLH